MKSIFIYNPESGKGRIKKHKAYIISELSKKYGEVECIETTHPTHASEIARNCKDVDYLFCSGGDGTLNEIVNGLGPLSKKPTVGYIPSGTVNDVGRSLKLSKNIKKAVKILTDGETFSHDIFKVNDRYGIYVCCAGLFTKTSYTAERKAKIFFGKLAYFFKALKELFNSDAVSVSIKTEEEKIDCNCAILLILNSKSAGGFPLNKDADLNDGVVDVLLVPCKHKKIHFLAILKVVFVFLLGIKKFKNNKKFIYRKLSHFTLTTN
ncbi:MAG: YegS/Rv2252/BmrU family lipid kinase, partial [Clostridia bacterium]|nr:YegS/Rv2252/BmrU family lipid kinase [Clostridia bacterium]